MRIHNAVLNSINIPFAVSFRHSSAERSSTESVLVTMTSATGNVGYGESCPRHYVTGENLDSVRSFFCAHINAIKKKVCNVVDLVNWIKMNKIAIDANPAAMCAIEMAILDLLGGEENVSIEKLLNLPELEGKFKYTAVLGDSSAGVFRGILRKYLGMGFNDFKIKLSGDIAKDQEKCQIVASEAQTLIRTRFDANNLWDNWKSAVDYLSKLDIDYFAIEEPLKDKCFNASKKVARESGKKIILDESFLRASQMDELIDHSDLWLINLRVSKMGGILRSLDVIDRARNSGVQLIIGAQVGETSLLTRAALTVANYAKGLVIAQEGAFGNFLLSADICEPPIMFGRSGELDTTNIPCAMHGLGIEVVNHHLFEPIAE